MITSSLPDYQWLCSPEGREHLAALAGEAPASPAVLQRLRQRFGTERARLMVEQLELRQRGRHKFADAQRMFFTSRLLEQATEERIAAHKAQRFPREGIVADLCCGLGGDLLALGRRSPALGVDRSPVAAQLARGNCRAAELKDVRVVSADVRSLDVSSCRAWHIDPDRRPAGRRTSQVDVSEPGLDVLENLLVQQPHAAIKLAPAAAVPEQWTSRMEREWIGTRRECRQQVAWFGSLARAAGSHTATVLGDSGNVTSLTGSGDQPVSVAPHLSRYLCEPHAAVLAARLTQVLAQTHNLAAVAPGVAYLTGDQPAQTPLAADFEVLDELAFDRKRLKAWLRARRIGRAEIKTRGLPIDPQTLLRQLKLEGDRAATILVYRGSLQARVVIAQRLVGCAKRAGLRLL